RPVASRGTGARDDPITMSANPMATSPVAPELPSLDPALLRRLASRLVRKPGEYGDLFLEASLVSELHRESDGGIAVSWGHDRGAAARVLLPDGSVRHVARAGLEPDTIETLPQRLAGTEAGTASRAEKPAARGRRPARGTGAAG